MAGISGSLVALSSATGLAISVTPLAPGVDERSPFYKLRIVIIKGGLVGLEFAILKEALIGNSGQLSLTELVISVFLAVLIPRE